MTRCICTKTVGPFTFTLFDYGDDLEVYVTEGDSIDALAVYPFTWLDAAMQFMADPLAGQRKIHERQRKLDEWRANDTTYLDLHSGIYRRSDY